MNKEIQEAFETKFTIDVIDFYDDGEAVQTFVYFADEVSKERASELFATYDEMYQNDEYDGTYEDFLQENNVRYWILK